MDANTHYGIDEVSMLSVDSIMAHPEFVRALLEHRVGVNDACSSDYTALQRAAYYGRADVLAEVTCTSLLEPTSTPQRTRISHPSTWRPADRIAAT